MLNFNEFKELDTMIDEALYQEAKNVYGQDLLDPDKARLKRQVMDKLSGKAGPQTDFEKEVDANKHLPGSVQKAANVVTGIKHLVKQAVANFKKSPEDKMKEKAESDKAKERDNLIRALKGR